MRRNLVIFLAASWGLLLGACGAEDGANRETAFPVTVQDSAGVEIVVNRVPAQGVPTYAVLDSVPDLEIGGAGGDSLPPLVDVRGLASLPDGTVAVADGATLLVLFYDRAGKFVAGGGGQGTEVGHFGRLSRMGPLRGDTVWVFDTALERMTLFRPDSGAVSSADAPPGMSVAGLFADGSFLLVPRWPLALHEANPVTEVRRDPARYLRWWLQSGDTVAVGTFPHDEMLVVDSEGVLSVGVPPFGRKTVSAVGPGRFYVGDATDFVVGGYDPDGTPRQSIRLEGVDLSITPEQVQTSRASAEGSKEPENADAFWAAVGSTRPAYTRLLLDAAGNLWIAEHVAVFAPPRNWLVFAPDGRALGMVTFPPGFTPFEIGVRHVLGVAPGADGTQRVVRYRLQRGG